MKTLFALILIFVSISTSQAMVSMVPLNKLSQSSDLIVRVEIEYVKNVGTLPKNVNIIGNLAKVNAVIKGDVKSGDKLKIKTYTNVEDLLTFQVGNLMLLFLIQKDNYYEVNCGIQGAWPIKDGKFYGMGTGKTVEDIKTALSTSIKPLPEKYKKLLKNKNLKK